MKVADEFVERREGTKPKFGLKYGTIFCKACLEGPRIFKSFASIT